MQELPRDRNGAIELFFREPEEQEEPVYYSVLQLLRKDIFRGLGFNPENKFKRLCDDSRTIWLGVMGVMAGVDLLGKFVSGKDDGSSSHRFKNYLRDFMHIEDENSREVIYQLRNSILHSFGWYSVKRNRRGQVTAEYRFTLSMEYDAPLVVEADGSVYLVAVSSLHKLFETSIYKYRDRLQHDLQDEFAAMFPTYGWMRIGPPQ